MKKILVTSVLLSVTFFSYSQTTRKVDDNNVQIEEIIDEERPSKGFEIGLKTDLSAIILGDIPLLVEVPLGYNFSIEAGLFVTYNDLAARIRPSDYDLSGLETKSTLGFQLGFRHYFDQVFDSKSPYFELNYRHKNLTWVYPDTDPITGGIEFYDKVNRFAAIWGVQWVFANNFLFDLQAGVGYQFGSSTRLIQDFWVPQDFEVLEVDDQFAPLGIQVGIRFGYVFR